MIRTPMIAALLLGATALPASPPTDSHSAPPEARIRQMGRYLEAVADPQRGVYIRAYDGQWYYARVEDNCTRLTRSAALRFEPSPGGYFDRNSALRAGGWRCLIASVTLSHEPPRRRSGTP
ncbi:MAG TPA: hypothetical protein VIT38_01215 [Allosphingosinicella sp.]